MDLSGTKKFFDREFWVFGPIYFFLAFINLRVKLWFTPIWFNGRLVEGHKTLLEFNGVNNDQSRVLQFWIPELFRRIFSISIEDAYILQRWVFVFLALICFHKYLRKWFSSGESFSGALFVAAIMPLTYFNHLQESAPLLMLTFLLALWAIRENRTLPLLVVFFVGGMNNETMLILPLVYFTANFKTAEFKEMLILCRNTLLVSLPLLLTVGPIRYITRGQPHGDDPWQLPYNIEGILVSLRALANVEVPILEIHRVVYLYIFFIFSVLWVYAFMKFKDKPVFLRRASIMIPFFILAHFFTGIIYEVRQMLPLSFLIIPMAFFYIFPADNYSRQNAENPDNCAPSKNQP